MHINRKERFHALYYLNKPWIHHARITEVNLANIPATDKDLHNMHIGDLQTIWSLELSGTDITDESLREIGKITDLGILKLDGTRVTDKGIEHLSNLHKLHHLFLSDTQVTGKAIEGIAQNHPKLMYLHMEGSNTTDSDMEPLAKLQYLYELHLGETQITGTGLVYLRDLPELRSLDLNNSDVTDEGITEGLRGANGFNNLVNLHLDSTDIGDESLLQISRLRELQELDVGRSRITDEGLRRSIGSMQKLRTLCILGNPQITRRGILSCAEETKQKPRFVIQVDSTIDEKLMLEAIRTNKNLFFIDEDGWHFSSLAEWADRK